MAFPAKRVRLRSATRPEWLSGVAAEEWDRLAPTLTRLGDLDELLAPAFACLCVLSAELRCVYLRHESLGPGTRAGHMVYRDLARLNREWLALAETFFLTPASRARRKDPEA